MTVIKSAPTAAQNPSVYNSGKARAARGEEIAALSEELSHLDKFENDLKNKMQDRLKFMSAKNARLKNEELDRVEKDRLALQIKIARLQE